MQIRDMSSPEQFLVFVGLVFDFVQNATVVRLFTSARLSYLNASVLSPVMCIWKNQ